MNELEHYIKEIYSVKELEYQGKKYLKVDIEYDCYGSVERKKRIFTKEEFEEMKKKGYFMA